VKIGVFTALYHDLPLEAALGKIAASGVEAVELSTGNYAPSTHCDVLALLADRGAARRFNDEIAARGLVISGLSQHGNPLHPQEEVAARTHETWRATVQLAELLEVPFVLAFSGCPGDRDGGRYPNWVTCAWPDDYPELLEWQWSERVLPYWTRETAYAREHGVRIAIEMHPGFVVYSPETMARLRAITGPQVGCNYDPSHMFWQGIDPIAAIRILGDSIFHVHAKDTQIYERNLPLTGVLDTKNYTDERNRSWIFRTCGYGHGAEWWKEFVSALRMFGYDYVLSIEHEDSLMSPEEGLIKAASFLNGLVVREQPAAAWWV